jgi:hypothetical protein
MKCIKFVWFKKKIELSVFIFFFFLCAKEGNVQEENKQLN